MSTGNFHNVEASRIFAIECLDEMEYSDTKDNIFYNLESKFGKMKVFAEDKTSDDSLRSFYANVFAIVDGEYRTYDGEDVYPVAEIIARSAYYSGANFDYNIKFNVWGEIFEDVEDINAEEIMYLSDFTEAQAERYVEWMKKFLSEAQVKLREQIEEVFAENTIPLNVVARFSNGETMYEKAI